MKTTLPILSLLGSLFLISCGAGEENATENNAPPRITRAPKTLNLESAQPKTNTLPVQLEGPVIEFEATTKNFGKVPDTQALEHGFKFRNIGTETLHIRDIKPSCGCTTTTLAKTSFAPGEGDQIDIVWEPKGHGPQRKNIKVQSNSRRAPILQLDIQAEIEPFLQITPNRADFKAVQRLDAPELILDVACQDPEMEILDVKATTPDVEVSVLEPAQNGRAKLRVVLSEKQPTTGVRRFFPKIILRARARLKGVGDPIEHKHEIPVLATLYDHLVPEPAIFGVGRVLPGRSMTKAVVVSRPSGEPFEITGASLEGFQPQQGTTVRFDKVGPSYRITLTCNPGAYEGPIRGKVALTTNVPEEPTLFVDAYGVSGKSPSK